MCFVFGVVGSTDISACLRSLFSDHHGVFFAYDTNTASLSQAVRQI